MKPKGRWIERYNLELDDKDLISKVLFNTSEILKVNVKPKVLWFIQHVYSKNTSCSENQFEDDDSGNAKLNLNYDEITCPIYVISDSEEAIDSANEPVNNTYFSSTAKRIHDKKNNNGRARSFANVARRNTKITRRYSIHYRNKHASNKIYKRKPFNESQWNTNSTSRDRYYEDVF